MSRPKNQTNLMPNLKYWTHCVIRKAIITYQDKRKSNKQNLNNGLNNDVCKDCHLLNIPFNEPIGIEDLLEDDSLGNL